MTNPSQPADLRSVNEILADCTAALADSGAAIATINSGLDELKKSHSVIRNTDGTGDTNYGWLSLYEVNGIRFVSRTDAVEHLPGAAVVPVDAIPEFVSHITLRVNINLYKEVWVYPLKKEDIRGLGEALSKVRRWVATAFVRDYASWEQGKLVDGPHPLSTYYTNITAQEEESCRF